MIEITYKKILQHHISQVWDSLSAIDRIRNFHPLVRLSKCHDKSKRSLNAKRHLDLNPCGWVKEEIVQMETDSRITTRTIEGKVPFVHLLGQSFRLARIENETEISYSIFYKRKRSFLSLMASPFIQIYLNRLIGNVLPALDVYLTTKAEISRKWALYVNPDSETNIQ